MQMHTENLHGLELVLISSLLKMVAVKFLAISFICLRWSRRKLSYGGKAGFCGRSWLCSFTMVTAAPFFLVLLLATTVVFFWGKMNVKEESKRKQSQQIEEEVVIFRREAALD